ncbi:UDP-2,4-diacetamido-2,4,6-trideoxy-beta-L-altropyranose hydrolase [Halosegnis rubeus]|uniref:UDP-2,4-diacetamido-2,4, 6-trideoxy-beta-L-altropyranose hydrolase n=1 Tax=Halosegnis rubeus TaxID=2212850 RepID=A0A5N5UL12_9EURY|nr:UDP-2,4-diacetamido-2,4,6-trideoxy-beta-L-altropyranose hydrolase [Halosegnis rubeus]KAB7519450.1 UDP-2,4-diacetamido-2,4,6-trideoxy-beta-L-altropyranose hydrolase [Halosegnis rubeus]
MHVAIRADGGPDIGYGHLVRSSAFASHILKHGGEVTYATTTPESAREVLPPLISIVKLPTRGDPQPFIEWIYDADVDLVYTDSYPVDTDYQRAVRKIVPLAVFLDDARYPICADAFVNGNIYAPSLNYEFTGDEPEWCLGTDYTLLREKIRAFAAREPIWRPTPEHAVVTMGGSDVAELTPTVVQAFDEFNLQVDVIVGPGFSNESAIRLAAKEIDAETNVVRNPSDLPELLYRADLAVSACGSTIYELLALGTPIIGIPVVDNQEMIASSLRDMSLGTVVERTSSKRTIRKAVRELMTDSDQRRSYQVAGRQTVDGQGVERVTAELFSLV